MGELVKAFRGYYNNMDGAPNIVVYKLVTETIERYLNRVSLNRADYFTDTGHATAETFAADFREAFFEKKLSAGGGLRFLAGVENDDVLKAMLTTFVKQFYSVFTMTPEAARNQDILDEILKYLGNAGMIVWGRTDRPKRYRRIEPQGRLDFDKVIALTTANFKNSNEKREALWKVIDKLNTGDIVLYAHLFDEVNTPFAGPPRGGKRPPEDPTLDEHIIKATEGRDHDYGVTQYDEQHTTERPVVEDTNDGITEPEDIDWDDESGVQVDIDPESGKDKNGYDDVEPETDVNHVEDEGGIEIYFQPGPEIIEECLSILAEIEPVSPERVINNCPNERDLTNAVVELPHRIRKIGNRILKTGKIEDIHCYMLYWLIKGEPWAKGDGEVVKAVANILEIGQATVYDRFKRATKVLRAIRDNDETDFSEEEILCTLLMFYKVYKRKCVVV